MICHIKCFTLNLCEYENTYNSSMSKNTVAFCYPIVMENYEIFYYFRISSSSYNKKGKIKEYVVVHRDLTQ